MASEMSANPVDYGFGVIFLRIQVDSLILAADAGVDLTSISGRTATVAALATLRAIQRLATSPGECAIYNYKFAGLELSSEANPDSTESEYDKPDERYLAHC